MFISEKGCKWLFGCFSMLCVTGLQLYSWYSGHDGVVFATNSAIMGGIIGGLLGFSVKKSGK